jgi:SAM-dependent methyltransferase
MGELPQSVERARDFWDESGRSDAKLAIYWHERMLDPAGREEFFEHMGEEDARRLAWFVHPEARVLDLGCGIGRVMKRLAPHCREIVGIDISAEMVARSADYLRGVGNARVVRNDGWTLLGVEDGSIDFAYSLLCLIHVDKRNAYQYLREIKRVLAPGGLALLQFQDILTDEGLAKFVKQVGGDYPLEFYTRDEVEKKLCSVGLDVLAEDRSGEYFLTVALNGDAAAWRRDFAADLVHGGISASGGLGGDTVDLGQPGQISVRVRTRSNTRRVVAALFCLTAEGEGPLAEDRPRSQGVIALEPGSETEIVFACEPATRTVAITANGRPAGFARKARGSLDGIATATLHLGLLPSGFHWSAETLRLFPTLFTSRAVRIASAGDPARPPVS